jgi:predicted extracellular nuclease
VTALNEAAGRAKWAKVPAPQPFATRRDPRRADLPARRRRAIARAVAFPDGVRRPSPVPVAQTFAAGTDRFTVVANHFKSKGCGGATGADADQRDGQGCFNATRVAQAEAELRFVRQLRASTDDPDVVVSAT